jgi:hypothetical protein
MMTMQSSFSQSVKGTLNFAADKSDGGEFSNTNPVHIRQNLRPVEVEIRNVRALKQKPALDSYGFTLTEHPCGRADWTNKAWIDAEYIPSCVELVKRLTGAKKAVPLYGGALQRHSDPDMRAGRAPAARFIHLDQPREAARAMATADAEAQGVKFRRGAIFNVWKATTPPPQDVPLAVCDWRTVSESDYVLGKTVEEAVGMVVPHIALAHSAQAPQWYYAPDMTADESWVFVGADLDPTHPLGCAHSAFVHPAPNTNGVRRSSIEMRVLACYD